MYLRWQSLHKRNVRRRLRRWERRRFVHTLCLYTNMYVMFLHTTFPYPQNTRLKSRKNRGGKAEIDDDEEEAVEELEVAKAVCTLCFCTQLCWSGLYTHCVCTQMCTLCLYTLPFLTHRTPGWRAGRIEVVRQRSTTMKRRPLKSWRWQRRYVHFVFVHNCVGRVCTHIVFVHKCVRHVCTHFLSVPTDHPAVYTIMYGLYTHCVCTQLCTSCAPGLSSLLVMVHICCWPDIQGYSETKTGHFMTDMRFLTFWLNAERDLLLKFSLSEEALPSEAESS